MGENTQICSNIFNLCRAAMAGKLWSLPRFWVSIRFYKKQPIKKICGRILDLAWLKFAVAALHFLPGWSGAEIKSTLHVTLLKRPINKFQLDQQSKVENI